MKKHGDISCRAPHERAVRRFHREAPYEARYGANFSFASTRDRLAQVSASAFDQLAERAVRFVVSVELSHYILNHTMTTSWVSKHRANEFRKYTEPVHIEHLKETRCYLRRSRNGVTVDPYYSMTNVDAMDAIEPTSTYVPQKPFSRG